MELSDNHAHWQSIIDRQKESGLSVLKFCRQEEINHSKFRYYKDRLKAKAVNPKAKSSAFAPVKFDDKMAADKSIKITYPNGVELTIPESVGSALLANIIQEIATC